MAQTQIDGLRVASTHTEKEEDLNVLIFSDESIIVEDSQLEREARRLAE